MSVVTKKVATKRAGATSAENDTDGPKPFSSSVKGNALTKVRSGFVTKKQAVVKTVEKLVQTDNPAVELVTGETPSLEYWKLLSESQSERLEEANRAKLNLEAKAESLEAELQELKQKHAEETLKLNERVRLLQEENESLESMLEDAKTMAEYVQALPDSDDEEDSDD